jgi:hypothetical protein
MMGNESNQDMFIWKHHNETPTYANIYDNKNI